ncbi:ACP S-malonyltransferase [Candidatus Woesearchaeota archaeon]|nr:ACP S-malonyltransferase [Candidatus Woesearchaeota archaeon]
MFKALLTSQNTHLKDAAEKVLEGILRQIKPEVFDIYYNEGVDHKVIHNTVNVQPAIAAVTLVWYRALESVVGERIVPDVAGGYSLGDFVATSMLGVLSDEDLLRLTTLRGEVFTPIKPGQFYLVTALTKDTAHVHWLNWGLKGTGYRVSIRNGSRLITFAGPASSRSALEEKLVGMQEDGTVARLIELDGSVYYVPFHHNKELSPYASFFASLLEKYCRRESKARGHNVFLDPQGTFVTNDGKKLDSGTAIMRYLASTHIKNLCNFAATMQIVGRMAETVIGLGELGPQKKSAEREGYIRNFVVVNSEAGLEEAARVYNSALERRSQQAGELAQPSEVLAVKLQPQIVTT